MTYIAELEKDVDLHIQINKQKTYLDFRIFWKGYPTKKGLRFSYKDSRDAIISALKMTVAALEDN